MKLLPLLVVSLSLSLAACGRDPGRRETPERKDPPVRKVRKAFRVLQAFKVLPGLKAEKTKALPARRARRGEGGRGRERSGCPSRWLGELRDPVRH